MPPRGCGCGPHEYGHGHSKGGWPAPHVQCHCAKGSGSRCGGHNRGGGCSSHKRGGGGCGCFTASVGILFSRNVSKGVEMGGGGVFFGVWAVGKGPRGACRCAERERRGS